MIHPAPAPIRDTAAYVAAQPDLVPTRRATQRERIALRLRRYGVVRPHVWNTQSPPDGGGPIRSVHQRITELRREGWLILTDYRGGATEYALLLAPPAAA